MARDWEGQFRDWAGPPGKTESDRCDSAVSAIRNAVKASSRLASHNVSVFSQGSYRNNTNVRKDSDVDIGLLCTDTYFYDLAEGTTAESLNIVPANYGYDQFKNEVEEALVGYFGRSAVKRGNKAFDIHETTYHVEADVAAFAGDDPIASALPDQSGDAEAGAGTEDDARGAFDRLAGVQRDDALWLDERQAVGGGGEIVGQRDARNGEATAEFACGERPWQVGELGVPAVGRPGDAEAGGVDGRAVGKKFVEHALESRVVGAGEALLADDADAASRILLGQCQQGLGAAEVAAEEHRVQTATWAAICGCGS